MSDEPQEDAKRPQNRRHIVGFDWRLALLLGVCLLLASIAVTRSHSLPAVEDGSEYFPILLGYKIKITDLFVVVFTAGLVYYTAKLNAATEKLWAASQSQEKLTRDIFIATQRPWLNISIEPKSGLIFNKNCASIEIECTLENSGNSAAINANVWCELVAEENKARMTDGVLHAPPLEIDTGLNLREFCKSKADFDFYNRPRGWGDGIPVFSKSLGKMSRWPSVSAADVKRSIESNNNHALVLTLYICVTYYQSGVATIRHTGYKYDVVRKYGPGWSGVSTLDGNCTDVPQSEIVFHPTIYPSTEAT